MNEQQQQSNTGNTVEVQGYQEPSLESQEPITLFTEMDRKQLDFLNESGKSLIERIAPFLAVLLGISVLSNNFLLTYLKGDLLVRILIIREFCLSQSNQAAKRAR